MYAEVNVALICLAMILLILIPFLLESFFAVLSECRKICTVNESTHVYRLVFGSLVDVSILSHVVWGIVIRIHILCLYEF